MIYIHIPFCRQICSYCDFHHSASLLRRDEMVGAIIQELKRRGGSITQSLPTLYLGGGTPSVCTLEQIGAMVELAEELQGQLDEVTLEANPEDLTPAYLAGLRQAGINRLSIGIQSFHDDHLKFMNRRHTANRALQAITDARQAGFSNITIDLIYGLPWLTNEQWMSNIQQALELGVEHISAYHLTIEPQTLLGKRHTNPVEDSVSHEQFMALHNTLREAGYEHYEVSNFALPGFRGRHNSGYWQGHSYLGVGPSAHSYDGSCLRHWNVSSNKLYLGGDTGQEEELTDIDLHNEYVMTRLRCADGFSMAEYRARFSRDFPISVRGLVIEGDRVRIEPCNFLISDSIIASLFVD